MSWLHTWAGLVLGWILYFMFITGSAGYFDNEIDRWMQPEIPFIGANGQQFQMLNVAEDRLNLIAPAASTWRIKFPLGRYPFLRIEWKNTISNDPKIQNPWQHEILDPNNGKPITARDTGGGQLLYRMHYVLHYIPTRLGYWFTSLCAMFMLIALITGIIIHKKIFKDFFTLRLGKKQRTQLDMHNILSVLPIPFYLMITYSGLIFVMLTTLEGVYSASYGFDKADHKRFFVAVFSEVEHTQSTGIAADMISLTTVIKKTQQHWGTNQVADIEVSNRYDINASIKFNRWHYSSIGERQSLNYQGTSGELLSISDHLQDTYKNEVQRSNPGKFYEVMTNLHEGEFAGTILRGMYFISGLMGAGMIASGMILWATKRRSKVQRTGEINKSLLLVESLNIGTLIGLPIAIAAYFYANRLIPVNFLDRANWEINTLFITWAIMLTYPLLMVQTRSLSTTKVWFELLALATIIYALLPVINAVTTGKHLGITVTEGDWMMAGFDIAMLGISVCFACATHKMKNKLAKEIPPQRFLAAATENSIE
jgi:uncharacterized iron-regulated membrane protein